MFRYPTVMFVHFPQGVQSRKCWEDFNFKSPDGEEYIVTQIIQYLNKKRHFISWSYDFEGKFLFFHLYQIFNFLINYY